MVDICRNPGVTETPCWRWKEQRMDLGGSEMRELKLLREENRRVKTVVADLTLARPGFQFRRADLNA